VATNVEVYRLLFATGPTNPPWETVVQPDRELTCPMAQEMRERRPNILTGQSYNRGKTSKVEWIRPKL